MYNPMTRRDFLRYTGLGGAMALIAACQPVPTQPMQAGAVSSEAVELELLSHHQIEQEPFVKEALEIFTSQHPEITVKFVNNPDYKQTLLTRAASKTLPAVFLIDSPTIPAWRANSIIANITDFVERDLDEVNPDDFWEAQIPELRLKSDGTWSALPYDFSNVAMAVNMDILESNGYAYPTEEWTWADIAEMGKTITTSEGSETWGINGLPRGWWLDAFLQAEGAALLNPEWNECIIDTPEAATALQSWADMYLIDKTVLDPFSRAESTQLFYSGNVGIQMCGSWDTLPYRENIGERFHWDTQMVPVGTTTGNRAVVAGGASWVMSDGQANPEESWTLLKFLASQEAVDIYISNLVRSIPGRKSSAYGAWLEAATQGNLEPEHVEIFLTSMDFAVLIPQVPFDKELGDIQNNYLDLIYSGKVKAADILGEWQTEANEAIARYNAA